MSAVYKKELKSYFTNMTGYIAIALILAMTGFIVKIVSFSGGYPTMELALPTIALILMLAVPILTMKSFAEERHQKTDLLLYTLPLKTSEIVLGKYLAMMTVLAIPTVIMMFYPLILSLYGNVGFLASYTSILAFYLLSGAMVAICMFMSSLTESQVIAAVLGAAALILCYASPLLVSALPNTAVASFIAFSVLVFVIGLIVYYAVKNYWIAFTSAIVIEAGLMLVYLTNKTVFAGLFQKFISALSIFEPLSSFVSNQLVDMTTLIYYLSISFLFCFLTAQTVEKRRWS